VDGDFFTEMPGAMRQVNPSNLSTVFSDNNDAIILAGESPLADSQFQLSSGHARLVINARESDTRLSATLGLLNPALTSRFTLAHVVLADGAAGTWRIGILQRDAGGVEREYSQSGVFGFSVGALSGDYNVNGTVDAADYVLWRDTLGLSGSGPAADGNGNGQIDPGDYDVWRADFGQTVGASAIASRPVPEPATFVMLLWVVMRAWGRAAKARSSAFRRWRPRLAG
jgi:hypothetical protein